MTHSLSLDSCLEGRNVSARPAHLRFDFRPAILPLALVFMVVISVPRLRAQAATPSGPRAATPAGDPVVTLEQVTVFGDTQATSVDRKKNADTISSFLSTDGLGVLPDDTLGDALTRLAGVNFIPGGEASASSVSIRGMEGKLNSVEINGVSPAQANPLISGNLDDTRSFDVSLIPAEMVGSVEVMKSITADQDSEAIGGKVNVETANAFSINKRVARLKTEFRYREQGAEKGYGANVIFADTFGRERKFGAFLNLVYKDNHQRPWRTEFRQQNQPGNNVVPELERLDLRDPSQHDTGLTFNASFDLKLSPATTLFARPTISRRKVSEFIDQTRLFGMGTRAGNWWFIDDAGRPLGNFVDSDNNGTLGSPGDTFVQARDSSGNFVITPRKESAGFRIQRLSRNRPDRRFKTNSLDLGGKKQLDHAFLDYRVNWSDDSHRYTGTQVQWDTPGAQRNLFRFRYDNSDTIFPTVEAFQVTAANGFIPVSPRVDRFASLVADQLNRIRFENGRFEETQWVGQANYTRELRDDFKLKTGVKYRFRDRKSLPTTVDWVPNITVPRSQFQSAFGAPFGAYDGRYAFTGLALRNEPVLDFFTADRAARPSNWALSSLDINAIARSYAVEESVTAAYMMGTYTVQRLTLLAGVRVERTDQDVTWRASNIDPINSALPRLSDISKSHNFTNTCPSAVATYRLADGHLLRAAATRTIARPDFADIIPYQTERVRETYGNAIGQFDTFPLGSPQLKPQRALNFDLAYEFYYGEHASISVTGFYKKITDSLVHNTFRHSILFPSDPFNPNSPKTPVTVSSNFTSNGAEQEIRGLEFTWTGNLKKILPAPFDGFGWVLNYTLIHGEQTLPVYDQAQLANGRFVQTGTLSGKGITGQPERIANAQVYYELRRFSLRLAYSYVDSFKLDAFTTGFAESKAATRSLDASLQIRIAKQHDLRLLLDATNLTKERSQLLYIGQQNFPEGYEQRGRTWVLGLRASL